MSGVIKLAVVDEGDAVEEGVAIGGRGNNGEDGLGPIGFREFLAHGAKKRKRGPSLVLGQAKECVAIQHYHFNALVDLNALKPVSPLGL